MSKVWEQLQPCLEKAMAIRAAMVLFEWDNETLAPAKSGEYTASIIGTLSNEYFQAITNDEVQGLIGEGLRDASLSEVQAGIVKELARELEMLNGIPPKEYRAFAELTAQASRTWALARKNQDFESFAPVLKEILKYQKKFASYRAKQGEKLYDVMLDTYEKGFDMARLDVFFKELKRELVPFLRKIVKSGKQIESEFLTGDYKEEQQAEFARLIATYVGFDFDRGVLAVSEHPFTTSFHNHDVRITTHYSDSVDHSIFSVIHEAGHAIYELGVEDALTLTPVGEGTSMGMHESQSRFFENIMGRNPAFWEPIYGTLQDLFPKQLECVSLEDFVRAVNRVEPGLIRTEADELTYSLHVMIRYEIEKMLVEEDFAVEELPNLWADKYEEYLGIRPQHVSEGVLQDIHWSQGSFGYFPSYALGSAFGAQIYHHMKSIMDFEGLLAEGRINVIREYLREHIHRHGKLKTSREILKEVTGEDFTPKYYIEYLKEKYSKLYEC